MKRPGPRFTKTIAFPPLPTTSAQSGGRKRDREDHSSDSSVTTVLMSDGYETDCTSVSTAQTGEIRPRRKRGRPPTTGQYVGLHEMKKKMEEMELEELERQAERELEKERAGRLADREALNNTRSADQEGGHDNGKKGNTTETGPVPTEILMRRVEEDVEAIRRVATQSKNLKGTYVKTLKEASFSILEAAERMNSRTTSREVRVLQSDNDRLRAELQLIKRELQERRTTTTAASEPREPCPAEPAEPAPPPTPRVETRRTRSSDEPPTSNGEVAQEPTLQAFEARIMRQIGQLIDARFDAIAERLAPERTFRPSLGPTGGDEHRTPATAAPPARATAARAAPSAGREQNPPLPREAATRSTEPAEAETWATVARKGRSKRTKPPAGPDGQATERPTNRPKPTGTSKKDAAKPNDAAIRTNAKNQAQPNQGAKKRSRRPRTAAIVVTLTPEAVKGGATYAKILAEAREKVGLEEQGLSHVKLRVAQTGARIIEVAGSDGKTKADQLADKIRTALSDRGVSVSRPEKTADIRLLGLDESVTTEEVIAAIRGATQTTGHIKAGPIRMAASGMGTQWVSCPVAVAEKLAAAGRLLVGWSSVRVRLLAARPLQCFRCMERGHTAQRCPTEKDRSGLCHRCGKSDHQAATCQATPNCPVCHEQGREAAHRCGGPACKAPSRRGKPIEMPAERCTSGNTATTTAEDVRPSEEEAMITEP